jgi:DNA-binding transcriptional ArsR family regulator
MYARDDSATAARWQSLPPAGHVEAAAGAFAMLADPTRLRLLWLLCGAEHDVTGLAAAVGAARPAVSQHLAKLRMTGLVGTRRNGRRVLYRARGSHVRTLLAEALEAAAHTVGNLPEHD